uniref:Transmembrane protein 35B n=1 Tax=Branchiostoma floridae TaxID=7739 RepID=C3YSP1_BRAFL|eukprot:XP_002600730.1 hypothetical protein BRAFLDRAFT_83473 [Branchiostoma floridae]
MASGAAHLLSMGLGLFFCTTGLPKLFSFIPAHKLLKDEFVNFAAVFPLKPLGIVPNPTLYLYAIGVIELGCGVMLGLGSHEQQVATCHSEWASNVHQIGGKSPSSSSNRQLMDNIVAMIFHMYLRCCTFVKANPSQQKALS